MRITTDSQIVSFSNEKVFVLPKENSQKLGLSLGQEEIDGSEVTFAFHVKEAHIAKANGIQEGWILSRVNDMDIRSAALDTISSMIIESSESVKLVFSGKVVTKRDPENKVRDTPPKAHKEAKRTNATVNTGLKAFFGVHSAEDKPKKRKRLTLEEENMVQQLRYTRGSSRKKAIECIEKCGCDLAACQQYLEEKIYQEQLNRAQIESESAIEQEKTRKQEEDRKHLECGDFKSLYPNSMFLTTSSSLRNIADIMAAAEKSTRDDFIELLKLESQSIKWYARPAEMYLRKVKDSIEKTMDECLANEKEGQHIIQTNFPIAHSIKEHVQELRKHLYAMPEPEYSGCAPRVFLEADIGQNYALDEDGFELVDIQCPVYESEEEVVP